MGTRWSVTALRRSRFWKMVAMLGGLAVIATVGITACNHDAVGPTRHISTLDKHPGGGLGPLTRANVGVYHNQFLDFVFPRLTQAVAVGSDRSGLCTVIARAMRDFVVAKKIRHDGSGIGNDIAGPYCADAGASRPKGGARRSLADDGVPLPALESLVEEMAFAVAENRPIQELRTFLDAKVAYARATFPPEEADVAAATASVALSSAEYWDMNYVPQETQLVAAAVGQDMYSLAEFDGAPVAAPNSAAFALLQPPDSPLSDGWLTRIRESSWYPKARKVGGGDIEGALRGALAAARAGPYAMLEGALLVGAGASASELLRQAFME